MIGVALIEECIKHGTEVYAVVREGSKKRSRLPESSLIKFADCSLEHLDRLPEMISQECDTFYHIAWGNTGENRNSSTELQSRNIGYTLAAVKAAAALGCKRFYRSRIPGRVRSAGSGQDFTRKRGKSHNSLRSGKAGIRISGKDALQGTGNRVYLAQNIQCLWNL